MSWDDEDNDWEAAADDIEAKFEAQQKEKERQRRIEEGLESESEEEKPAAAPVPKGETKPKPKPKPKADKKKAGEKQEAAPEGPLSQEEKLRQRALQEESERGLASDLFGDSKTLIQREREEAERAEQEEAARQAASKPKVVIKDAFDDVELNVQADVEKLCSTCVEKLNKSQAKTVVAKFLMDCVKQLEGSLDIKELAEVEKLIVDVVKLKTQERGQRLAKDNKANTKLDKHTKFNASSEWEEVYGGGEGDEEWTQEEWDEWYKTNG